MFLLKRTQSPVLDIDISSTSSKLLELSRNGAGLRVENHALEPVSPNAIAEKMISNADAVGAPIARPSNVRVIKANTVRLRSAVPP